MIPTERWLPADGLALEPYALEAAKEVVRNLALTAGPGAGKTEMLAQRADFLLRTGSCRYPKRILAISFKTDAAQNLKIRVRKRCGLTLATRFDSHTFHAFAKRLIDRFRPVLKGVDALNPDYSIAPRRIQHQSITFADMAPLAIKIVMTSPIARNAVRQTYSHVFLDEFQDCTSDQYRLIVSCFGNSSTLLTAVGDTKQSIMGWAGAVEGIFLRFTDDFTATPLNLYQNFRSAPRLRRMQNAMVKKMDPPAALDEDKIVGAEGVVKIFSFADDGEEAEAISAHIRDLIDNEGVRPSECAVLVSKQVSLYCQSLKSSLDLAGIPYREEDSVQDLTCEPVARLIIDFLLVTSGTSQAAAHRRLLDLVVFNQGLDDEREYQLRSKWNRFLSETRYKVATNEITVSKEEDLEQLVASLVEAVGRDNFVALSPEYAFGDRLDNLIRDTIAHVQKLLQAGTDVPIALASFSGDSAVRIMSIHKSKGLEFEIVFILGVEDQTFWGDLDAERSAYFVGISRAKTRLFLTFCAHRKRPNGPVRRWDERRTPHAEFLSYA